ncbi:MAG TPA: carbohydrate ABC transporter permease [Ruminiclostridium sp.]
MINKFSWGDGINYIVLGLVSIVCFLPIFYVLSISFTDPSVFMPLEFKLFPEKLSLASYYYIISTSSFRSALTNSVMVSIAGTMLNVFVTFTGAYALSKSTLPGYKVILSLITFTLVFSAGMVPSYMLVKGLHLINSYWAIILPVVTNAWSFLVVRSFMVAIPSEIEEAAKIDGCNDITLFARIIIPLSMPAIATFTLFFAVDYWNAFFNTMLYITNTKMWTLPLLIKSMIIDSSATSGFAAAGIVSDRQNVPQETVKMAAIILSMLPIVILYPFLQKYFVKGVMIGAVKG